MITIGLTGSIGMGKSTALQMFADIGAAVWCADDAVHRLYEKGGAAVAPIAEQFPGAVSGGVVDRTALAKQALHDPEQLKKLETIVHPLVSEDRKQFLIQAAQSDAQAVVLDIPLLFEGGSEDHFDVVVVVSAPDNVQRARVLARPGMSEEKLAAILAQQTPDAEKRKKADYVISTNKPLEETEKEVQAIYKDILARFSGGAGLKTP